MTSLTEHPNSTTSDQAIRLFEKRPAMAKPLLLSVRSLATHLGISLADVEKTSIADLMPPLDLCTVSVDLSFMEIDKKTAPGELIMQHFLYPQS